VRCGEIASQQEQRSWCRKDVGICKDSKETREKCMRGREQIAGVIWVGSRSFSPMDLGSGASSIF
jgi:hypothetical protein